MKNWKRLLATGLCAAMVTTLLPATAFAATYTAGTYQGTATVVADEDEDFENYDITVNVDVDDQGNIWGVQISSVGEGYIDDDESYIEWALNGRTKKSGTYTSIPAQLTGKTVDEVAAMTEIDVVSGATCVSAAMFEAVKNAVSKVPVVEEVVVDTEALTAAVDAAKELVEADYTAESWTAFSAALEAAEEALTAAESQDAVDATLASLTEAQEALVKAEVVEPTDELSGAGYVLMNIPYAQFYAAEGDADVDAVSSATKSKTRNSGLAAGSYHVNTDGSSIDGVIYPVYVEDLSVLADCRQITDEDIVSITVSGRGGETTTDYTGKDALFEADSYAYYVLTEEPSSYKVLTADNGSFSFGEATGDKQTLEAETSITTNTAYGDYQIEVDSDVLSGTTVYGVVLTADNGMYGLRHLENIWRVTELAFSTGHTTNSHGSDLSFADYQALEGHTITGITYYTSSGIYEIATDLFCTPYYTGTISADVTDENTVTLTGLPDDIENAKVSVYYAEGRTKVYAAQDAELAEDGSVAVEELLKDTAYTVEVTSDNYAVMTCGFTIETYSGYVLMNIPYAQFYAAEGDADVDTVTSATKAKTMTGTLVAGSYHAQDGSAIYGVTYPVYVEDLSVLADYTEIGDEDSYEVTVSNRGQTTTTTYEGKDALFGADSYAYYVLTDEEAPASYKTLIVNEDGTFSFSAATGDKQSLEAETSITTDTAYGDYQISVEADALADVTVYGVVLSTENGDYGLRHLENIWRITELAFSIGQTTVSHGSPLNAADYVDLEGQTITGITYYTSSGIYAIDTNLYCIPYFKGQITAAAENETSVKISGIPSDAENAVVSVYYSENRTQVFAAENAEIAADGTLAVEALADGKTYTVKVNSDNYAVMTTTFTYTAPAEEPEVADNVYVVSASALNVRAGAGTSFAKIGSLTKGTEVEILEYSDDNMWAKIDYNGEEGWISAKYVSQKAASSDTEESTETETYTVNTSKLNVRAGAGTNYSKIGYLTKGTKIEILEEKNGWGKIVYKGSYGWISLSYCKAADASSDTPAATTTTYKVTASTLNVRAGIGTKYAVLGKLKKGETVEVLAVSGSWGKISYNGKTGWISLSYCAKQ